MADFAPFRGILCPVTQTPDFAARAADYHAGLADGSLVRDEAPAVYRWHQSYWRNGKTETRKGFIALHRLRPFAATDVLAEPEAAPDATQLEMLRSACAHSELPVLLYSDFMSRSDGIFQSAESGAAAATWQGPDGDVQQLFRVTDATALNRLGQFMVDQKFYLAEGAGAYQRQLALRDELLAQAGGDAAVPANAALRFGAALFCCADDARFTTQPAHRVLHGLARFDRDDLLRRAPEFFRLQEGPLSEIAAMRQALFGQAKRGPTLGLLVPGGASVTYLRLRGDLIKESVPALAASSVLSELDVTLLHGLVFDNLLGLGEMPAQHLDYVADWEGVPAALLKPGVQAVFLLNPQPAAKLCAVAAAGQAMPQQCRRFVPRLTPLGVISPIDGTKPVFRP